MSTRALLRRMVENNAWSNLRLHRACAELDDAAYRAPRTSFFPSIPATLNHIYLVDLFYIDAISGGGRGRAIFESEPPREHEALFAAQRESDRRLIDLVAGFPDEASLERPVTVAFRAGPHVEAARDVLLHLLTHQMHHRGQVHAMLSGTSVAPPQLDEYFLAADAPLRTEELRALGIAER